MTRDTRLSASTTPGEGRRGSGAWILTAIYPVNKSPRPLQGRGGEGHRRAAGASRLWGSGAVTGRGELGENERGFVVSQLNQAGGAGRRSRNGITLIGELGQPVEMWELKYSGRLTLQLAHFIKPIEDSTDEKL